MGNRAFQIVCHRARMFANLSEKEIVALADTLLAEGGGKINCRPLVVVRVKSNSGSSNLWGLRPFNETHTSAKTSTVVSPAGRGIAQCCPLPVDGLAFDGGTSATPESPLNCKPTKSWLDCIL